MAQLCVWDGFLARDVQLQYSPEGKAFAMLRLRSPAGFKKDGKDVVDFLTFKAFDEVAEKAGTGNEGDPVVIWGRVRAWSKGEGDNKTYGNDLICTDIMLGAKAE